MSLQSFQSISHFLYLQLIPTSERYAISEKSDNTSDNQA